MKFGTGAFSAIGGQSAGIGAWMTVVQEPAAGARAIIGGRAVVPVDVSGNATQVVELPPEPVLPMEVDRGARAGNYMLPGGA